MDNAGPAAAPVPCVAAPCRDEWCWIGSGTGTGLINLYEPVDSLDAFAREPAVGQSECGPIQLVDDPGPSHSLRKEFRSGVSVSGPSVGSSAVDYQAGIAAWDEQTACKSHDAAGISVRDGHAATSPARRPGSVQALRSI